MLARLAPFIAAFAAAMSTMTANAERRVALVIGNSAYSHAAALRNPGNDAQDVAETLKKVGFDVQLGIDLDQPGFARTIEQFARMLDEADVGLFFYAGHGVQMNDKNYLVSVNAKLENEFLLSSETIELDAIVRLMESKAPMNLVFLDACRNNPLTDNLRRSLTVLKRSAQLGRGLARIDPTGRDTLIAFSAAPGQEAADGSDRNSPFTAALLRHLPQPGLEVSVMLKDVAADVRRDTRNSQRPQQLSDMTKTFYFAKLQQAETTKIDAPPAPELVAKPSAAPIPFAGDDRALDMAFWNAAQSSNDCDAIRAYLMRFPTGVFVELATLSEKRLCSAGRKVTMTDTMVPDSALTPAASLTPPPALSPPAGPTPPPAVIAALPELTKSAPLTEAKPLPGPSATELTRVIQLELYRLGCGTSEANGKWSQSTREGLRKFNASMHAKLDMNEPSHNTMAALQRQSDRACPMVCGRGFVARGTNCVAVAKPEPLRKSRHAEQRSKRPARAQRQAPAAQHQQQQQPVASSAPMIMGPPMGGFFFMGGFGRHH